MIPALLAGLTYHYLGLLAQAASRQQAHMSSQDQNVRLNDAHLEEVHQK